MNKALLLLVSVIVGGVVSTVAGIAAPDLVGSLPAHFVAFFAVAGATFGVGSLLGSKPAPAPLSTSISPARAFRASSTTRRTVARDTASSPRASAPKPAPSAPVFGQFRVDCGNGSALDVVTSEGENGTAHIAVTATGFSGSEYKNRIRPKLENVRGVKWQHPKNLAEKGRVIEGTIAVSALGAAQDGIRAIR